MDLQQVGRPAMEGKNEAQMAGVCVCMCVCARVCYVWCMCVCTRARPDSAASHRAQAWISLFSRLPAKVMRIVERERTGRAEARVCSSKFRGIRHLGEGQHGVTLKKRRPHSHVPCPSAVSKALASRIRLPSPKPFAQQAY